MAKRKKREQKEERELTRKEVRLRDRDRDRNRRLYLGVGAALALALLIILVGALYAFAYVPNSTLATVGDQTIVTKDFWQRMRLERSRLLGQLANLQQLEQQFGQSFFTSQINQIEAQLQSPFALGVQVLDQMIDEDVIVQEAAARGITVSDDEIKCRTAGGNCPQSRCCHRAPSHETAVAAIDATATATLLPPTLTPTIDASLVVTATSTPVPTPEPLPACHSFGHRLYRRSQRTW
ncbi:MAG: SurA N-terminal domain-containing protein [Caldilineaceae bacterium]